MLARLILITITALSTYAMVQIEMQYYNQLIDFYLNMLTHFLGGLGSGLGLLIAKDVVDSYFPGLLPAFSFWFFVSLVFIVGLAWEVFEVMYRSNEFFTQDTFKDMCMDTLGAFSAYAFGRFTGKNI